LSTCDKAKALDQLLALKMGDHEQPVLLKSASGSTSASDGVAGLLSQRALPSAAEPAALPLPAPTTSAEATPEDDSKANDVSKGEPSKTLEEYELQARQSLSKRKAKSLDKCLKRPAACKAKPGPQPKAKAKLPPSSASKKSLVKKGIFGCLRCRGNSKGCSTCWNPDFQGLRFSSREEWVYWKRQQEHGK